MSNNRKFTGRVLSATSEEYIIHVLETDTVVAISNQVMHKYCSFNPDMLNENGLICVGAKLSLWQSDSNIYYPNHAHYKCSNEPSLLMRTRLHTGISQDIIKTLNPFSIYSEKILRGIFSIDLTKDQLLRYVLMLMNDREKATMCILNEQCIDPFPVACDQIRYIATARDTDYIAEQVAEVFRKGGGKVIIGAKWEQDSVVVYGLENICSLTECESEVRKAIRRTSEITGIAIYAEFRWVHFCKRHLLAIIDVPGSVFI